MLKISKKNSKKVLSVIPEYFKINEVRQIITDNKYISWMINDDKNYAIAPTILKALRKFKYKPLQYSKLVKK